MRAELSTEPRSFEPNRIARSPAPPGASIVPWTLPAAGLHPTAEWQRYLAAALRFKWVVLAVTLASTALGVLGALLVKPTYVARATVWVQVPIRPARDEGPIWSGQLPISSGWMDLLQSYAVLDDVVRGLRLYVAPVEPGDSDALRGFGIKEPVLPGTYRLDVDAKGQRFTLTAHGREAVAQEGSVGDSVGAANGFAWVPPASVLTAGRRGEVTVTAPYEAAGGRVGHSQPAVPARPHVRGTARREGEPRGGPARPRDDRASARAGRGVRTRGGCARDGRLGAAFHGAGAGAARPQREAGGPAHPARALHRRQPGGAARSGGGGGVGAADDPRAS